MERGVYPVMFKINSSYGNSQILCDYVGVPLRPIWGEIQHSLWMDCPDFGKRSRLFKYIYVWNKLLNIQDAITIGDPYLYFDTNRVNIEIGKQIQSEKAVILMPKFRRRLSDKERLVVYMNFIKEAAFIYPEQVLLLKLHHTEISMWRRELKHYQLINEIKILQASESGTSLEETITLNTILKSSANIYTDYVGPHVLRRLAIFGKRMDLSNSLYQYPSISKEMREFVGLLSSRDSNLDTQVEIANILLGRQFKKDREELGHTLGLTGFKGKVSFGVRKAYSLYQDWTLAK